MAKRVLNTKPSLPMTAYAGRYSDPFYGTVDVELTNGKLHATFGKEVSADLDHWQFDTFMGTWNKSWWGTDPFTFQLSPMSGDVVSLTVGGAVLRREQKQGQ